MDSSDKPNFFSFVFKFDEVTRNEVMNIGQYVVFAAIMVSLMLKGLSLYFPKLDEKKETFIVTAEIIAELAIVFFGFILIHRIIDFIPTISGTPYMTQNMITIILPFLFIILNTQTSMTSVGDKVTLISNRLFGGSKTSTTANKVNVRVSQPIAGNNAPPPSLLPQGINVTQNPMNQPQPQVQPPIPEPDFNTMFASSQQNNAANPDSMFEPQAANSFGGSSFNNY